MSEDRSDEVRLSFEEAVKGWRHERRGCPVDEELAAYVGRTLRLKRWLRVWWHLHAPLRRCALCRADLSSLHKALSGDKRELDDRQILVCAQAAERLMHEVLEIVAERAAASRRPSAELVMRKNRQRIGTRFSPVRVPGYAVTMALLGPLVFLGAWGGMTYMAPDQRSAIVEQLQSNNEKFMFHLSAMGQQLTSRLSAIDQQMTPQVTVAANASLEELEGFRDVLRGEEAGLERRIELAPVDSDLWVSELESKLTKGEKQWDIIAVDNDTLGTLIDKGLLQPLSHDRITTMVPPDGLFQELQNPYLIDGQAYAVPLRANVKLVYYNKDRLEAVEVYRPPETWDELAVLARKLHEQTSPDSLGGRLAIQAHEGKAAAVTVFEWVTSMGGDPLTLDPRDPGVRQAFERLWDLAPYLERASTTYKFDSANKALFKNKVSLIDNWTYGIKVLMGDLGKKDIEVTDKWPGSKRVLGGDVLAIPTGVPPERKEWAIKLIERLVAKETQRKLAERLYWAPVREDVYNELSAQNGYFHIIHKAVGSAVMRPITPKWAVVETILSDALQDVLEQGRAAAGREREPHDIEALLQPHAAKLREIAEIVRCPVVARMSNPGDEWCNRVVVGGSLQSLAAAYQVDPDVLAKLNGRSEAALVSPESMPFGVLVPKPAPRS